MKYKIGDKVQFISNRDEGYSGMFGIVCHTKQNPSVESNILSGDRLYPIEGFDYTIVLKSSSVELILNVYENELR